MATVIETIRKAMEHSGQTRYRIAKETGIAQSQLSRLASGERGLDVATIEKLAAYLGLEIVIRPAKRKVK